MARNHNKLNWAQKTGAALMAGFALSGCTAGANNCEEPNTTPVATAEAGTDLKSLVLTPEQHERASEIARQTVLRTIDRIAESQDWYDKKHGTYTGTNGDWNTKFTYSSPSITGDKEEVYDRHIRSTIVSIQGGLTIDGFKVVASYDKTEGYFKSNSNGESNIVKDPSLPTIYEYRTLKFLTQNTGVFKDGKLTEKRVRAIFNDPGTILLSASSITIMSNDISPLGNRESVAISPDGTVSTDNHEDSEEVKKSKLEGMTNWHE